MQRSILYDEEQADPFDILWALKDVVFALGHLEEDLAGSTATVASGLGATATGPASLIINIAAGRVYQQGAIDPTAYGALPSDTAIIQLQGISPAQTVQLSTAALTSGQSMWALVQAQISQTDVVRTGDPTAGVLNYWNSANPAQPFQGPNDDGSSQPTERKVGVTFSVVYGTPATTGSEVPPNPTAGFIPLYLIDLAFGQTTVATNQILVSGPSVGSNVPSNYPRAPFLAGLLNAHHSGGAGQAPQIDLTTEVQHVLPLANTKASNTSGGGLPVLKQGAGNPNGSVAGNFNVNGASDLYWDTTNQIFYICTVTGTTSTAVWTAIVGGSTSIFAGGTATGTANAQVVASTTPSGFARTPGQVVTYTAGTPNTTAATLNVDGTGAAAVQKNSGGSNVPLTGGELSGFITVIWTGTVYLLQSQVLGALATLNIGAWLKNDGSGNITLNVDPSLQDNGSGKLQVTPGFLPPAGSMLPYAGTSAPTGYLMCVGQAVSRTTYAALFAVCGIAYGSGDGVTTFNVPDARGFVVAGADTGVGRLTTATMSSQSAGGIGGSQTVTLTLAQLPSSITSAGPVSVSSAVAVAINPTIAAVFASGAGSAYVPGTVNTVASTGSASVTSNNTSGAAHPNVQPTLEVGGYIIKT